jgi:hypothetical protein
MKRGAPPSRRPAPMLPAQRRIELNSVHIQLPLRVLNYKNEVEHWTEKARRTKNERRITGDSVRAALNQWDSWDETTEAVTIHLTRVSPRKLDSDNLQRALSAVRDGVADALGINDGSDRLTWTYEQEQQHAYGVRIEIRERA